VIQNRRFFGSELSEMEVLTYQDDEAFAEIQGRRTGRLCFNAVFPGALSTAGCIPHHHLPRGVRHEFGNPVGVRSSRRFFEKDADSSAIALHIAGGL
jgi:hypothetical protein